MTQPDEASRRYRTAIQLIDAANATDPSFECVVTENKNYPKEVLYAERMSSTLSRILPKAPVTLRLAVRAQHIQRWKIPRKDYPKGRQGYRHWRTELGKFHAETTAKILQTAGYTDEVIRRVKELLRKERLKIDPECQLLEDVICLVFIEHYLEDFATKHDDSKLLSILRKTWKKMSTQGRTMALELELPERLRDLISRALS